MRGRVRWTPCTCPSPAAAVVALSGSRLPRRFSRPATATAPAASAGAAPRRPPMRAPSGLGSDRAGRGRSPGLGYPRAGGRRSSASGAGLRCSAATPGSDVYTGVRLGAIDGDPGIRPSRAPSSRTRRRGRRSPTMGSRATRRRVRGTTRVARPRRARGATWSATSSSVDHDEPSAASERATSRSTSRHSARRFAARRLRRAAARRWRNEPSKRRLLPCRLVAGAPTEGSSRRAGRRRSAGSGRGTRSRRGPSAPGRPAPVKACAGAALDPVDVDVARQDVLAESEVRGSPPRCTGRRRGAR